MSFAVSIYPKGDPQVRKNIYIFVVALFMGAKNVWKWLMALLDVLGVFAYPMLSTFAFSGLTSGFFLSVITYPTHGWGRVSFWIGAVFGLVSFAVALCGITLYMLDREGRRRKALPLRIQDLHA
jgi:hypothetical protein